MTDTWLWELLATCCSLASMIAIIAMLVRFNGQDIIAWSFPYNITINAIVATLNTISKSLLIYALSAAIGQWKWILITKQPLRLKTFDDIDRCSRGPLGSVQMLWDLKM